MSTIGIQSTANQCQSNGLSSRVPYDVGRSISTCSSDADQRHRDEHGERRVGSTFAAAVASAATAAVEDVAAGPHQPRGQQAEADDAERAVRRAAMPCR